MSLLIAFAAGVLTATLCARLRRKFDDMIVIPFGTSGIVPDVAYRVY